MDQSVQRITIERIVQGGDGLSHLDDGRVVMVPRVLPDEVVDVRITEEHESYVRAEVVDVAEPSEDRIEPECPYAPECGGCQFWHTTHEAQFDLKVEAAVETLERVAGRRPTDIEQIASPNQTRYRTHATFHRRRPAETDSSDETSFEVGFFREGSNELITVDDCLVACDAVNRACRAIEPGLRDIGDAEMLVETADDESCVVSVRILDDEPEWDPPNSFGDWGAGLDEVDAIRGVRVLTESREWVLGDPTVDADQCLADSPLESMRIPAGMFRQANPAINRRVVQWVADALSDAGCRSVLELFCGTGNISFGLRDQLDRLLGVEVADNAVQTANTMAQFKQIEGFEFRRRDLTKGTGESVEPEDGPFDAVVMDPPRGGARSVLSELNQNDWMGRSMLVYVSCDPPALARDLAELTEGPWALASLAAFDMFPMTSHLEMGAILRRE